MGFSAELLASADRESKIPNCYFFVLFFLFSFLSFFNELSAIKNSKGGLSRESILFRVQLKNKFQTEINFLCYVKRKKGRQPASQKKNEEIKNKIVDLIWKKTEWIFVLFL